MTAPSIDQFAKALSKEPDWYSLGVFLGAPSTDLDYIKHEYRGQTITRYLIEMYKCLERLGKAPTWNSIAVNLKEMGNHFLADQILLEPLSSSSETSSSCEQTGAAVIIPVDQINRTPEAIIDSTSRMPTCRMNEKQIKQLHKQADALRLEIETIRLEKGIFNMFYTASIRSNSD